MYSWAYYIIIHFNITFHYLFRFVELFTDDTGFRRLRARPWSFLILKLSMNLWCQAVALLLVNVGCILSPVIESLSATDNMEGIVFSSICPSNGLFLFISAIVAALCWGDIVVLTNSLLFNVWIEKRYHICFRFVYTVLFVCSRN